MISQEVKLAAIVGATILGVCGVASYSKIRTNKYKFLEAEKERENQRKLKEMEVDLPPEYWTAKAAEHEASVNKHEIDILSKERLEIDKREREDAEREKIREFEKDAPDSYWQHKKVEEEEQTKRECMRLEDERSRRIDERERDIAKERSKEIANGAKLLEKAIRSSGSYSYGSPISLY